MLLSDIHQHHGYCVTDVGSSSADFSELLPEGSSSNYAKRPELDTIFTEQRLYQLLAELSIDGKIHWSHLSLLTTATTKRNRNRNHYQYVVHQKPSNSSIMSDSRKGKSGL
jgi:hypothetical protein